MDIKSLIDTILQSIATGTSSDVRINDRTFFSELMDDREDDEKAGSGEIRPRKPVWSSRKRFPLFSFLYSLLESLLSVVVWALYEFFSLLYGFFREERGTFNIPEGSTPPFSCLRYWWLL